MTTADSYHDSIAWTLKRKDQKEILALIENFYSRVEYVPWRASGVFSSYQSEWKIKIDEGDHDFILGYSWDKNSWTYNGSRISDARISEILSVPVSYLEGFKTAIHFLSSSIEGVAAKEKLIDSLKRKLKKDREDLKNREDMIHAGKSRRRMKAFGAEASRKIAALRSELESSCLNSQSTPLDYPDIPAQITEATTRPLNTAMPEESGIYFVWSEGRVVYVGQSVNLRNRTVVSHDCIEKGDYLSFVLIDRDELNFAECFYISLARPERNFGWVKSRKRDIPEPTETIER